MKLPFENNQYPDPMGSRTPRRVALPAFEKIPALPVKKTSEPLGCMGREKMGGD